MLEKMWRRYQRAASAQAKAEALPVDSPEREKLEDKVDLHLDAAHNVAKDAAPYIHARLASVVVTGDDDGGPVQHEHRGLVGFASLSAADLAKLDSGQLAQLYREAIAETAQAHDEPEPDSA